MCYFWSRVYLSLSLSLSFSHHVCVNPVEIVCCFWRSAEFFSQVDDMSNSLTGAVYNFKVLKWKNVSYAVFCGLFVAGSLFLCAIQGPVTGVLWSEQQNDWRHRGKSSNLFVRTIYTSKVLLLWSHVNAI
jgi:hypothetical protein